MLPPGCALFCAIAQRRVFAEPSSAVLVTTKVSACATVAAPRKNTANASDLVLMLSPDFGCYCEWGFTADLAPSFSHRPDTSRDATLLVYCYGDVASAHTHFTPHKPRQAQRGNRRPSTARRRPFLTIACRGGPGTPFPGSSWRLRLRRWNERRRPPVCDVRSPISRPGARPTGAGKRACRGA